MKIPSLTTASGSALPQYGAAVIVNLLGVCAGNIMGWASPTQQQLQAPGTLHTDPEQWSWVAGLFALGAGVGPLPSVLLLRLLGPKRTLLFLAAPLLLGWLLIAFAPSVAFLYAARFILGVAAGTVYGILPAYVGEISQDSIRGSLGTLFQLQITVGYLYSYCLGPYISYLAHALASAAIPVVFFVTFLMIPDSPYYLVACGKRDRALEALKWFRRQPEDEVRPVLDAITAAQASRVLGRSQWRRGDWRALGLAMALVIFQQLSGINAVLWYSESIFRAAGSALSADVSTIIVGVVMFLSSGLAPLVVDRFGRIPLLLISAVGMAASLSVLGGYFQMLEDGSDAVVSITWLPILSMVMYIILYCVGFGSLPWAVVGELFSPSIKGAASPLSACVCWILGFFITKFFVNIQAALGTAWTFWLFAIFCLVAAVFVRFLVPETKGKSLEEIQDILNR